MLGFIDEPQPLYVQVPPGLAGLDVPTPVRHEKLVPRRMTTGIPGGVWAIETCTPEGGGLAIKICALGRQRGWGSRVGGADIHAASGTKLQVSCP